MSVGRSLEELLSADIDGQWMFEVMALRDLPPVSAAEAVLRLKIFARGEAALAGDRIRETAAVERLAQQSMPKDRDAFAEYDVALALTMSPGAADRRIGDAATLVEDLPVTLARLRAGRTTPGHALRLAGIPRDGDQHALLRRCERAVWRKADGKPGLTPNDLGKLAERVMERADPDAFASRNEQLKRDADVSLHPDPGSGMAWLSAYLPLLDAATVMTAVDAGADAAKLAGDDRPIGMLRAEALRRLAEADLLERGYAEPQRDHLPVEDGPGNGAPDGPDVKPPVARGRRSRPRRHGRPAEVHVAISFEALQGLTDHPGEIPGFGPVPAEEVRRLAEDAAVRLLVYDSENGGLLDYGRTTYRAPDDLAAAVCATYPTSGFPGATTPSARCDLDHGDPWPQGGTDVHNLTPLNRRCHRAKTAGRIGYTKDRETGVITWLTGLNQVGYAHPYDYRLGP